MEETRSEEGPPTSPLYSDVDEAPPPSVCNNDCDRCSFDAIVVGSGYGGAVAACRLAQAGLRVCVLERGRRFEPHQFPRSLGRLLLDTTFHTAHTTFGRANALYQIHMQGDSIAVVASGLGGGSLVNAGLLMPTPKRTRKDPLWPIEWEQNWDLNESKASAMLGSQNLPIEFPSTKVMDAISGEIENCMKDTIHLNVRMKAGASAFGTPQKDCIACGNCFTGCPYDAKNSTEKNYIAAAVQFGAQIHTECDVHYILRNDSEVKTHQYKKKKKRWRVYLNDVDFLLADYVVLSGGVLGTTGILMKSRERGLELSSQLGFRFSTNGNNVAYVAECRAPTAAYGLTEHKISNIPIPLRPGPSISASFTSSLGFTIQGAVLPSAFPNLLFKGIFTYQWEGHGYGLVRGIWDKVKQWMGTKDSEALVLNMMGVDAADGRVELDSETHRFRIFPPHDPMLSKKMLTFHKLSKRLGGTLFMSRHRSTSVHLLGACPAAYSEQDGVVNPYGQIFKHNSANTHFSLSTKASEKEPSAHSPTTTKSIVSSLINCNNVHPGLYACDASIIPCAVGINPSLTICTLAEHISSYIVQDALEYLNIQKQGSKIRNFSLAKLDPFNHRNYTHLYEQNHNRQDVSKEDINIEVNASPIMRSFDTNTLSYAIGHTDAIVRETMRGHLDGMPCTLKIVMHMGMNRLCQLEKHDTPSKTLLKGRVGGHFTLKALDPYAMYIIDGHVDMCCIDQRTPFTQYMHYNLQLASASGARYMLHGIKVMRPFMMGLSLWQESTTLRVSLWQAKPPYSQNTTSQKVASTHWHGTMRVSATSLCRSLWTMKGQKRLKFVKCLAKSLLETYFWGRKGVSSSRWALETHKYPAQYVVHDIKTEDGFEISCVQWPRLKMEDQKGPVLLLNGYSTESFWLPTEERDLVRALLHEGHEVWLLQTRLHPNHATSRPFNLDHVAKFDIPPAILRIHQVCGNMEKIHVVAHCVGGLSIHMAIMGGYVPATSIATLTCTNSGSFFRVSILARIKLWLPLIRVSMNLCLN